MLKIPVPNDLCFSFFRITVEKDTKVPNACQFTIAKEDHTLGNMIRMYVQQQRFI